ncbi:MAG: transglutaminase [Geobacteraceae bacterium]|nr:transglutaminase [Geobacteraceae bacterium]
MPRSFFKITAATVLFFFTCTSGGLFSVAHAAVDATKKSSVEAPAKKSEGAEEKLSRLTEELRETLADARAGHGAKRERLLAARAELDSHDTAIRAEFAATEQKLKDARLPAEILARHARFVKHYDDNLNELKGNIERVKKAKDEAAVKVEVEKTLAHLAKVKSPSRHQKLDPNNLPHRQPKVQKREPRLKKEEFDKDLKRDKNAWKSGKRIMVAATGSVAGLLPPDDLAETVEVQLTPEIRAKALELGNSQVKIYEWVRNNIKYEAYYGSLKGSQQTLLERSGNDLDQASLLIALLRAANIPAKYVYGTIEVPIERVMLWLGVKDPVVAANIIASGGIPAKAGISGGKITTVRLEHVWVEAFVSMFPSFGAKSGSNNIWTPIDPSFKEHELNTSVDISKIVPFNESDYLKTQSKLPPSLTYMFALEDYHTANYTGGMHEMFYLKKIKEHEFGILLGTLPYKTVITAGKFSSINASLQHKISIGLRDPIADESAVATKNISEIAGKKITISYAPATDGDRAVMTSYGGLLKTPAYLVRVKAQVKIDDTVVLEGPQIAMGSSLKLSLQFTTPGRFDDYIETDMAAGVYYSIGLSALNVADKQAIGGLDNSENLLGTFYDSINSGDEQVGKVLHNIGLQYFTHTNNASRLLEGVMHIYNTRAANAGFVSVSAQYREFFGITVSPPIIAGLNIDIPRYIQSPFSITGDKEQEKAFTKIQGLNTSYFEHAIWESFSGIDSVSTVKLLQLANEASMPIYTINSANISQTLPLLNQSQNVKDDIQNVVAAGKEVTIPKSYITRNEWAGTGYMVRNPETGEGAYMLSSGLAGGGSTASPAASALGLLMRQYAALAAGKPAEPLVKNEDKNLLIDDLDFMNMIGGMVLSKGYIPRVMATFSKKDLLSLFNNSNNKIFYYSGHGDGNSTLSLLAPGAVIGTADDVVISSEIKANAHIVFLNSCSSASTSAFASTFGVLGGGENRVFLGFDDTIDDYAESSQFGFGWWRQMYEGKTAILSLQRLRSKYTDYSTSGAKIRLIGDAATKL